MNDRDCTKNRRAATGSSIIEDFINTLDDDAREDFLDFAKLPSTTGVQIRLYLYELGFDVTVQTINRWKRLVIASNQHVDRIRAYAHRYQPLSFTESITAIAGITTDAATKFYEHIGDKPLAHRDIDAIAKITKEARACIQSMERENTPKSIKEMQMAFSLDYANRLEKIFEDDEVMIERVRTANKSVLMQIEAEYNSKEM